MPRHVKCNLCGEDDTRLVQKAEEPYRVVRCKNCGLVYTNPHPDREVIEEHYQEDYYREWIERQMKRRVPMWKRRLKDLQKHKSNGRLLDVGFGCGTFLKLAREGGFEVFGTEISEYACRYAQHVLELDVFRGELEEARLPSESFDLVTLWHCLEHLADPKAALKEIHRVLKKNGLLLVAVPNLDNYITRVLYVLARGKRLKLFSVNAKELHLWHFTTQSLAALLNAAGFKVVEVNLDLAQIEFSKKIVDFLTSGIHALTGKNYGEAMKAYALKAE